jgi:hypothetical protein
MSQRARTSARASICVEWRHIYERPSGCSTYWRGNSVRGLAWIATAMGDQSLTVIGLSDERAREGVCLNKVGASLEVLAVDLVDDVGPGEREDIVVPLKRKLRRVILENLPTEVILFQSWLLHLDHRAHSTIEHLRNRGGGSSVMRSSAVVGVRARSCGGVSTR